MHTSAAISSALSASFRPIVRTYGLSDRQNVYGATSELQHSKSKSLGLRNKWPNSLTRKIEKWENRGRLPISCSYIFFFCLCTALTSLCPATLAWLALGVLSLALSSETVHKPYIIKRESVCHEVSCAFYSSDGNVLAIDDVKRTIFAVSSHVFFNLGVS